MVPKDATVRQEKKRTFYDWHGKFTQNYKHIYGDVGYTARFDVRNRLREDLEGQIRYFDNRNPSPIEIINPGDCQDYGTLIDGDGPVGYWRLGEESGNFIDTGGTDADDASPTGGVTRGVTGALNGDSNKAVTLDGVIGTYITATVDTPANGELDVEDGPFSIEAWIKKAANGSFMGIVSYNTNGPYLRSNSNNTIGFNKEAVSDIVSSTTTITDSNWHHVVVTRAGGGSGAVFLYIDGVDVTGTVTQPGTAIQTVPTDITFGRRRSGSDEHFNGSLDEIAIYNFVLTAAQVLEHYEAGTCSEGSGVRLRLTFDTCDYMEYNRTSDYFTWAINCTEILRVSASGLSFIAGEAAFSLLLESSNPRLTVDSTDYLEYTRSSNILALTVGGTAIWQLSSTFMRLAGYARIGSITAPTNTTAGDLTAIRLAIGNQALAAQAHIVQPTVGNDVLHLISTATNDDPTERFLQGRQATTNNTITTINTIAIVAATAYLIEARVVAHRTGGAAGAADDSAGYIVAATFKNSGGTVTQVGATTAVATHEDNAALAVTFAISGTDVLLRVTGDTDNNYTWHSHVRIYPVST